MTTSIALFILILATTPVIAAWSTRFQHWYNRYDPPWPESITGDCSKQYQAYISYSGTGSVGSGSLSMIMSNVTDCLLHDTPEIIKANMATASVLMGLLPTILSLAGSSTVKVGLVALQRPLLALLLGIASPAVNPLRTFEYGAPARLMGREDYSAEPPTVSMFLRQLVSGMQYALALAATFNIAEVTYSLSIRTYSVSNQ